MINKKLSTRLKEVYVKAGYKNHSEFAKDLETSKEMV